MSWALCWPWWPGAANAGGFLAVGQYTSHMTGVLSSVADNLVHGQLVLAGAGVGAGVAFLLVLRPALDDWQRLRAS